jgi:hypothetical protein
MGYDVHITRAENWTDSEARSITFAEWIAYVDSDPEMRLGGAAEAMAATGETLRYENEGIAVWTAYSGHGTDGNMAWFDYRDGCIVVKNPDEEIRRKMYSIASALGALVQGDEGELYDESGGETCVAGEALQKSHPQLSWWKRILRVFGASHTSPAKTAAPDDSAVPFKPGQRVKDAWGNQATVLDVDPTAEHGLGQIRVQYDDGREVTVALMASGLELVTETRDAGS